jgi:hypothetical protein
LAKLTHYLISPCTLTPAQALVSFELYWKWSSLREYARVSGEDQEQFCGLRIDRLPLPFDVHMRI